MSSRTKLLLLLTAGVTCSTALAGCGSGEPESAADGDAGSLSGQNLVIGSWGGVWTDATKKYFADPFSEETGVNVEFQITGTDTVAPVILQQQQNNVTTDLVDGGVTSQLEALDYLEPIPEDTKAILAENSQEGTVSDYVWEYGITATIIACNPDIMAKCPTNAEEFWNVEDFPGPRAILDSYAAVMTMALTADGVPQDELFPMDIDRAAKKIEEIKPHVAVWPSSGSQQQQVMIDGEVGASLMWHGRAFVVKRDNLPNLEMYWDGGAYSQGEGFAVPKGAPNKDVAFAFLEWIAQHPENQAQWTTDLSYPTPTTELLDLVPPELAEALPASHTDELVAYDGIWVAKNAAQMQKAWQQTLAS